MGGIQTDTEVCGSNAAVGVEKRKEFTNDGNFQGQRQIKANTHDSGGRMDASRLNSGADGLWLNLTFKHVAMTTGFKLNFRCSSSIQNVGPVGQDSRLETPETRHKHCRGPLL